MESIYPRTEERPWGEFREFTHNTPSTVKFISIKQGESLSLQQHSYRKEFWRVLSGSPEIVIGDTTTRAKAGDEFTVPLGESHRISAPDTSVEILEISLGDFKEEDIVRIEDKYGRA